LDIQTSKKNTFSLGKVKGYDETFTFSYFEPFLGFLGITDPFTFTVE
jgi:hypothetical protein